MKIIEEILAEGRPAADIITDLKDKTIVVPPWSALVKEYDPKKHPVMNRAKYPDIPNDDGSIEAVTRITYALQRLAVKRMTQLVYGIPVKRAYKAADDLEQRAAKLLERILQKNRIDSMNIERGNMLFAGCEVATLWFAVEQRNRLYGIDSPLKIRSRSFSPIRGENLYPLFDELGDYIALSIAYKIKIGKNTVDYFDTYTESRHIKWINDGAGWTVVENEPIKIQKNPTLYLYRPTPIWEDESENVFELEWAMSRNGNYLRKNSRPVWTVFADDDIPTGTERTQDSAFKTILQYPSNAKAGYQTWEQAIDNLKFFEQSTRQSFFTQLQLPDWSFENMKMVPLSGEAMKQMLIDAQLKVKEESGRLLEFHDRELNVVRAFAKVIAPELDKAIDSLQVETSITPYTISEEKDTISNLVTATAGKAIISRKEAIEYLGWSENPDDTLRQIIDEEQLDSFELTK